MSRKVSAIVTENVFSGLISGQMYIFNALIQSASLLPASPRLISLCTVTRSVLDALKAWRTKCAAADSMGGFTREGNQQVPRKVLPTSLPLWAVETVLLQHIGARCQGCFWLGVADAARPVAPGSPGPPRGLRGSVLHNTPPHPATSFGELGTGKKRARTTEVQFCGVTPRPSSLWHTW